MSDRKQKYFGFVNIHVHECHFEVEAYSLESAKDKVLEKAKAKYAAKLKKLGFDPWFEFTAIHVKR